MDAMKFFDRFRRTPKETTKGNRTLSASELLAREAKAEAEAAKATAARQPTGPNRLRTSEEFRAEQREKKKQRQRQNQIGSVLREVLSGEVLAREALVRQVPFMLYLCLLTILYLGLGYQAERILREKQRVTEQLEEAVAEEKTLRSDFESQLQQSRLATSTAELGLEQPTTPPTLLLVDDE